MIIVFRIEVFQKEKQTPKYSEKIIAATDHLKTQRLNASFLYPV